MQDGIGKTADVQPRGRAQVLSFGLNDDAQREEKNQFFHAASSYAIADKWRIKGGVRP